MGFENITYKCGHTERKQLYGAMSERARKVAYFATIDCPVCQTKAALETNKESDLSELKGTEKQIAWALKIRSEFVEKWNESKQGYYQLELAKAIKEAGKADGMTPDRFSYICKRAFNAVLANTSAKSWIERRLPITNELALFAFEYLARIEDDDPAFDNLNRVHLNEESTQEPARIEASPAAEPEPVELANARQFPLLAACGQEQPSFVGFPLFAACGL